MQLNQTFIDTVLVTLEGFRQKLAVYTKYTFTGDTFEVLSRCVLQNYKGFDP